MAGLDETLALSLVDQGARSAPLDRAVLLAASLGGVAAREVADWPLDRRDRLLIDARIAAFGREIALFARCPACGEGNEAGFDLGALRDATAAEAVSVTLDGHAVALRAPTSRAVATAVLAGDGAVLRRHCAGREADAAAVEDALAAAFPLLDIRFDLACSACAAPIATRFDIVDWLWREIEALADRAIATVDRLARFYGWSEAEILALPPARRARYLAALAA